MAFQLPPLPYANNALEPHFDALTMEIHHDRHHAAYVNNLNAALEGQHGILEMSIEELMANISKVSTAIRNNGGGHYNHSLFWKLLSPNGGGCSGPAHHPVRAEPVEAPPPHPTPFGLSPVFRSP
jgi:Fe-Mn family superoxide dismutase